MWLFKNSSKLDYIQVEENILKYYVSRLFVNLVGKRVTRMPAYGAYDATGRRPMAVLGGVSSSAHQQVPDNLPDSCFWMLWLPKASLYRRLIQQETPDTSGLNGPINWTIIITRSTRINRERSALQLSGWR